MDAICATLKSFELALKMTLRNLPKGPSVLAAEPHVWWGVHIRSGMHALDRHGFGVASGSACAASTLEPSTVLTAMRVLTHGNVRLSLTRGTTETDVDRFLALLPGVVTDLRAEVGL